MPDGGFFQPSIIDNSPDFDGPAGCDCHKVIAIGAEADFVYQVTMLEGSNFVPFPVNKLPDCGGVSSGNRKVVSIRAEANIVHPRKLVSRSILMTIDSGFLSPLTGGKSPDFGGPAGSECHKAIAIGAEAASYYSAGMSEDRLC